MDTHGSIQCVVDGKACTTINTRVDLISHHPLLFTYAVDITPRGVACLCISLHPGASVR